MYHGAYVAGDQVRFLQPLSKFYEGLFREYEMPPDSVWVVVLPSGKSIHVLPQAYASQLSPDADFEEIREQTVELSEDLVTPHKRPPN